MSTLTSSDITHLLVQWGNGQSDALDQLFPLVEGHLRKIARNRLKQSDNLPDLDTVALVGDLYIKLTNDQKMNMTNRGQFFKAAAVIMRHIVIDHARAYRSQKRGAGKVLAAPTNGLDNVSGGKMVQTEHLLAMDEALKKLEKHDPEDCKLIEMRYFLGLTNQEIAAILDINERTVRRNLTAIQSWLSKEMNK